MGNRVFMGNESRLTLTVYRLGDGVDRRGSLLAIWDVLALTVFSGKDRAADPGAVLEQLRPDGRSTTDIAATLREAGRGYLRGNGLALLSRPGAALPWWSGPSCRFATSYCLPVRDRPVLSLLLSGDAPKSPWRRCRSSSPR